MSSSKRFGQFPGHPNLDKYGCYVKWDLGCDPCKYTPKSMQEAFRVNRNRDTKDPWRYKVELEAWSRNLGYRNQKLLTQRRWQASLLGPAWTELPPLLRQCFESPCQNLSFGRTSRRARGKPFTTPGPGTYFNMKPFKAPHGPHSKLPSFEWTQPCRFKDTEPSYVLACNRYRIIDPESIEMKPRKIVSLKGPYNLFSGTRDGPIYNKFGKPKPIANKSWPMALPGGLERFKKSHLGELNRTGRDKPPHSRQMISELAFAVRRPEDPGPTEYNVDKPRRFQQNRYGFNSSNTKGTMSAPKQPRVWPGVGRYAINRPSVCGILGQGHRHVFLSKVERTIGSYLPEKLNTF